MTLARGSHLVPQDVEAHCKSNQNDREDGEHRDEGQQHLEKHLYELLPPFHLVDVSFLAIMRSGLLLT